MSTEVFSFWLFGPSIWIIDYGLDVVSKNRKVTLDRWLIFSIFWLFGLVTFFYHFRHLLPIVPASFVTWLCIWYFDLHLSPVDVDLFTERNMSDLGHGLAINYWMALLQPFSQGDAGTYQDQLGVEKSVRKVLLVPIECSWGDVEMSQMTDRFKVQEQPYEFSSINYLQDRREFRSNKMTKPMAKIYNRDQSNHAIMAFDFPRTLESSMGPTKDINVSQRRINLIRFLKETETLLREAKNFSVSILVFSSRRMDRLCDDIFHHLTSETKHEVIVHYLGLDETLQ